jgi:hypothetical protein
MADLITSEISDRIYKQVNDDRAEVFLAYAKVYGKLIIYSRDSSHENNRFLENRPDCLIRW